MPKTERFKAYSKYLFSNHWYGLRDKAFTYAGRKCECCASTKFLVGHHMIYRTPLELCTPSDIMALCRSCHDILHWGLSKHKEPVPSDRIKTRTMIDLYRVMHKEKKVKTTENKNKAFHTKKQTPCKRMNKCLQKARKLILAKKVKEGLELAISELSKLLSDLYPEEHPF